MVAVGVLIAGFAVTAMPGESEVTGVVVAVDSSRIGQANTFTLLLVGGRRETLRVGRLRMQQGSFDAGHLFAHMATGQPVRATYIVEAGERYAVHLADAAE